VDSPHEYRAVNLWAPPLPPLRFFAQGAKLSDAIGQFLTAVLHGAFMPNEASAEVGIFFVWSRGKLDAVTPVAVIAGDQVAGPTAADLSTAVFNICSGVIPSGTALADLESPAIRLRVKLTTNSENPGVKRPLLDIAAIDFPLVQPPLRKTEEVTGPRSYPALWAAFGATQFIPAGRWKIGFGIAKKESVDLQRIRKQSLNRRTGSAFASDLIVNGKFCLAVVASTRQLKRPYNFRHYASSSMLDNHNPAFTNESRQELHCGFINVGAVWWVEVHDIIDTILRHSP
jgi:hypothetical protein